MIEGKVTIDLTPLEGMRKTLVSKILRKAVTEAARVVRTAVKSNADSIKRTGGFSKALGIKVKTYSEKKTAVAILGPRTKWSKVLGVRKRGKHKGQEIVYRPSKIAHLIEKGSKRSKARRPLGNAQASTSGQYLSTLADAIRRGIEAALSK